VIVQKDRKERSGMILPELQARTQQLAGQPGQDNWERTIGTGQL
jgi:hypothetical protein